MSDHPAALTPTQAAATLGTTTTILTAQFAGLPASLLTWRPAPDEWCVLETVGHLIEAEQRGFAGRIRLILAEDDHLCLTWDPPVVALARRDHERDPAALLAEFTRLRAASVALITALQPADLARSGRHPDVGRLAVADLLHEWVSHDQEHLRQILALIREYVWPHMGNAQRFSQP